MRQLRTIFLAGMCSLLVVAVSFTLTQPLSAEPASKNVGEQEGPALLDGPSLRDGIHTLQGVAEHGDGLGNEVAVFVL